MKSKKLYVFSKSMLGIHGVTLKYEGTLTSLNRKIQSPIFAGFYLQNRFPIRNSDRVSIIVI